MFFNRFNDTMVDLIHFSYYGNLQYPYVEAIPYPKVRVILLIHFTVVNNPSFFFFQSGRPNPVATLHIYQNSIVKQLQFPDPVPKEYVCN